jgi:hypothetical protein
MSGLAEVLGPHLLEELGQSGHLLSEEVHQRVTTEYQYKQRVVDQALTSSGSWAVIIQAHISYSVTRLEVAM